MRRQQLQRRLEPPGRGGRRAQRHRVGRPDQRADGALVAGRRRAHHVVGHRLGHGAALAQGRGGARVRGHPPALALGLVGGPAHERVAEAEAQRGVGRAHEVAGEQRVQRHQRVLAVDARRGGGQVDLERLARHGAAAEQRTLALVQRLQLAAQRRQHRPRHPLVHRTGLHAFARGPAAGAGELLQEERIAPAGHHHALAPRGRNRAGDQLARLLAGERLQLQQVAELLALGADQGARQRAAEPAGPVGHRHEHGSGGRAAHQVADQLDALGVRPVQVVHQQHQRLPAGQAREQLAQGPVGAVALGLEAGGDRGGPAELAEHRRELAGDAVAQPRELALADTHQVVAERVHQHSVGAARLELDPAAGEHERAVALGAQAAAPRAAGSCPTRARRRSPGSAPRGPERCAPAPPRSRPAPAPAPRAGAARQTAAPPAYLPRSTPVG